MQDVVLYATDTMADWEYAYLTAGLAMADQQQPGRFRLRVLADGHGVVSTIGRLRLRTDGDLADVDVDGTALLVLPGGETWFDGHARVLDLAGTLLERGSTVAAICGATFGLARVGLLDARRHTSNARDFVAASGYAGAEHYAEEKVVDDENGLITASATAPVDFAAAVFRRLELFPPAVTDAWYGLYTTGERRYYDALVGAGTP